MSITKIISTPFGCDVELNFYYIDGKEYVMSYRFQANPVINGVEYTSGLYGQSYRNQYSPDKVGIEVNLDRWNGKSFVHHTDAAAKKVREFLLAQFNELNTEENHTASKDAYHLSLYEGLLSKRSEKEEELRELDKQIAIMEMEFRFAGVTVSS